MVERMVGPGSCSVEQYRLLEVAQKPVDIVVEPLDLMVETDGANGRHDPPHDSKYGYDM